MLSNLARPSWIYAGDPDTTLRPPQDVGFLACPWTRNNCLIPGRQMCDVGGEGWESSHPPYPPPTDPPPYTTLLAYIYTPLHVTLDYPQISTDFPACVWIAEES